MKRKNYSAGKRKKTYLNRHSRLKGTVKDQKAKINLRLPVAYEIGRRAKTEN